MKKNTLFLLLLSFCLSCDNDEPSTVEVVEEGREIGAYIRTTFIENSQFAVGDSNGEFSIGLEPHDEKDGDLFEKIEVFLRFKDNTTADGDFSSQEVLHKSLVQDDFVDGQFGLPNTNLKITFLEALQTTGVTLNQVSCKDQFLVRLNIILKDGRSFTTGDASSKIIAFDDFWSSPYCYTINIVEPINEELFIGTYEISNVVEGPGGPTFGATETVEIVQGHSPNVREMRLRHRLSIPQEFPRLFRFTVACDQTIMGKNLLASKIAFCGVDPAILIGPDSVNGPVDPNDDSVFELWFVEGYLGFDGNCGFGTAPSRLRFSKQ